MDKGRANPIFVLFLLASSSFAAPNYSLAESKESDKIHSPSNPFTPKSSLIRYWSQKISSRFPMPPFLLSKASPLSAVQSAYYTKLISDEKLASHLPSFCREANLFCVLQSEGKQIRGAHKDDADFAAYGNKQFSNYGNARLGGSDQFKNYSDGLNFAGGSFARYSRGSTGHGEGFSSYASDGNVASSNFTSYGSEATGGSGDFTTYAARVNVPSLRFASYDSDGNGHKLSFSSYADDANSGNLGFSNYGKNGNGAESGFTSYATASNVLGSGFTGYGEVGNAANDSFKGYGSNGNNPSNNFRNYGLGGNGGADSFSGYRDSANAGTDTFQSYGRSSNTEKTNFANYGKSLNVGVDNFKEYAKGAVDQSVGFKIYGVNSTFKEYAQNGVVFSQYTKPGDNDRNRVEEGKFFRESALREGKAMKMPNIEDWMPERSFLPRAISSKLPFSSSDLGEIKRALRVSDDSAMEAAVRRALTECEREPSPGETKRCVGSIEDMIDFAAAVLGRDVAVRTTENVRGSNGEVVIGRVKGVNGGEVTESVSCHQSLYPYLVYYCHSVPKVRVYEAEILGVEGKDVINRGVAICHVDTSAWSPGHGAFAVLGYGPGLIEVCHWIYENDMTWTLAD